MRERIIKCLEEAGVSGYLIAEEEVNSREIFISGGSVDLLRGKDVEKYTVTIYVDHDDFRGNAEFSAYSSFDDKTLKSEIERAIKVAKSVDNKWYPLASPVKKDYPEESKDNMKILNELATTVFKANSPDSKVNSFEIFVNQGKRTLVNSEGLKVSYPIFSERIELITEAEGKKEPVEVYCLMDFKDSGSILENTVKEKLEEASLRANAEPTRNFQNINVFLTGEDVKEFLEYFLEQTSGQMAYMQLSAYKKGDKIETKDKLNITLKPMMDNSTNAAPFDKDGVELKDTEIIKDGEFINIHAPIKYAHYLGEEATGKILDFEAERGTLTEDERRKEPYIEILAFSDFLMDPLTGQFGGEIRLAKYYDGEKIIPFSGGSFTAIVGNVLKDMRMSDEIQERNGFKGPKYIGFKGLEVLGI